MPPAANAIICSLTETVKTNDLRPGDYLRHSVSVLPVCILQCKGFEIKDPFP